MGRRVRGRASCLSSSGPQLLGKVGGAHRSRGWARGRSENPWKNREEEQMRANTSRARRQIARPLLARGGRAGEARGLTPDLMQGEGTIIKHGEQT